jgi:NADPH:quinone reductase-like Zn-dependent oxidoreductase
MTATMRALVGGLAADWQVREVDVPLPGAGQILVRVQAAGVNRGDLYMLEGTYNPNTKTSNVYTAGFELAGTVDAVGPEVSAFAVGDRVMGATLGAFAPYALLDHRHAIAVPGELAWADAAALPVGLATEHDALVTEGGFRRGDRVLVVGATSSVGLLGVQLAKALGASLVIATTTSASKVDSLLAAGADLVVNPRCDSLTDRVNAATENAGVDIVLDHVGGEQFAELLGVTRLRGTIVNIGRLGGPTTTINLDQLSFRRLRIRGTTFSVRSPEERGEVTARLIPDVLPAVAGGRIRPIVDRVVAFDDAQSAADRMRANEAVGKLVLAIGDEAASR